MKTEQSGTEEWPGIKTKGNRGGGGGGRVERRMVRGGPLTAREGGPKLTNPSTCSGLQGCAILILAHHFHQLDVLPVQHGRIMAVLLLSCARVHGPSVRLARLNERHTERSSASVVNRTKRLPPW